MSCPRDCGGGEEVIRQDLTLLGGARRLSRLTSLPFSLFYFDVPQGTPAQPRPRRASLSIETRLDFIDRVFLRL
jgi:hypothetical protein